MERTFYVEVTMKILLASLTVALALTALGQVHREAKNLSESDPDRSISTGTLSALQADGIIDAAKAVPTKTWMHQLAMQKLGEGRMRQMYLVMFSLSNGAEVQAIAQKDVSAVPEQSGLVVYVVSKILQPDGKAVPARQ
jgi:hypothetical protein